MRSPTSRYYLKLVLVALAYFGTAMFARVIKYNPNFCSLVWLPTGILLGILLTSERRQWCGLACASLTGAYLFYLTGEHYPLLSWALSRFGEISAALLGAWLTLRLGTKPFQLDSVRNTAALILVGCLATQLYNATFHASVFKLSGTNVPFQQVWLSWYIINIAGIIAVVPLYLMWKEGRLQAWRSTLNTRRGELAACIVVLFLSMTAMSVGYWIGSVEFGVILLACIFWSAVRLGSVGVVIITVLTVFGLIFYPLQYYSIVGSSTLLTDVQKIAVGQAYIFLLIGALFIAQAIEERQRIEDLLAAKNAELASSLAHSERLSAELKDTNTVLQQATNAKTDFVRTVSHEIRNPLGAARMMAEVLLVAPFEDKQKEQLKKLHACLNYLQAVLDETLDLAQIELGQIPNKLTQFEVGALVGQTASIFEEVARGKGIQLRIDTGSLGDCAFQGSSTHLQRILINFLSNAFKFTQAGAVVIKAEQVSSSPHTVTLRFSVRDTGSGVPLAIQPKLFSSYARAGEPQLDGSARGAGLGLAVCQKLAELNGGSVGFESVVGRGSYFWVNLPLIKVAHSEEGPIDFERPDFSSVRTLVIDDDPMQRESMTLLLGEFGVTPEVAESAPAAYGLLRDRTFDLVFSDYNLGTANGIELLNSIRKEPSTKPGGPIFHLFTAHPLESIKESAIRAGFAAVHRKPLSFSLLYEVLASVSHNIWEERAPGES